MEKSGYYAGRLMDICDDMSLAVMKLLKEKGLTKGVEVKTNRGVFKVGVAKDAKTNRNIIKFDFVGKNISFTQYTINPFVFIDILEQIEEL